MAKTDFDPQAQGFGFPNSFTLAGPERATLVETLGTAIDAALGTLGPLGMAARVTGVRAQLAPLIARSVPERYGLCGGMAFAALDYFHAGRRPPYETDPAAIDPALRSYLWERLLESWVSNGATFLEWIARFHYLPPRWPFDGGPRALRDRTRRAWGTLKSSLDSGQPLPLGLVGMGADPFLDHQVVAFDYATRGDDAGVVSVYDMNCPGAAQTIQFDLSGDALVTTESCPRGQDRLAGFFCEAYRSAVPPV